VLFPFQIWQHPRSVLSACNAPPAEE